MSNALLAVGSDYEVFVREIDSGKIVSAIPLIGKGKDECLHLDTCNIHYDNILAEVNVRPATNPEEFVDIITDSLKELGEFLERTGHTYVVRDNAYVAEQELRHFMACEFGCDPDYDVFSREGRTPPSAHEVGNFRSAGGHVHVSYTFESEEEYYSIAKVLSVALSLGTTLMGDSKERRKLYGQAGRVRFKKYGVEVRSPSNIWLKYSEWIEWIFHTCGSLVHNSHIRALMLHSLDKRGGASEVMDAINCCDTQKVKDLYSSLCGRLGMVPSEELLQRRKFEDNFSSKKVLSREFFEKFITGTPIITGTPTPSTNPFHEMLLDYADDVEEDEDIPDEPEEDLSW